MLTFRQLWNPDLHICLMDHRAYITPSAAIAKGACHCAHHRYPCTQHLPQYAFPLAIEQCSFMNESKCCWTLRALGGNGCVMCAPCVDAIRQADPSLQFLIVTIRHASLDEWLSCMTEAAVQTLGGAASCTPCYGHE